MSKCKNSTGTQPAPVSVPLFPDVRLYSHCALRGAAALCCGLEATETDVLLISSLRRTAADLIDCYLAFIYCIITVLQRVSASVSNTLDYRSTGRGPVTGSASVCGEN